MKYIQSSVVRYFHCGKTYICIHNCNREDEGSVTEEKGRGRAAQKPKYKTLTDLNGGDGQYLPDELSALADDVADQGLGHSDLRKRRHAQPITRTLAN